MFALRMTINNENPVLAAAKDLSVLSALVTLAGKLGPETNMARPGEAVNVFCSLGGLTARSGEAKNEHPKWIQRFDVPVGSKVLVEIIELSDSTGVNSPVEIHFDQDAERQHFETCKKHYLENRARFEGDA